MIKARRKLSRLDEGIGDTLASVGRIRVSAKQDRNEGRASIQLEYSFLRSVREIPGDSGSSQTYRQQETRMNLPDVPIAHEGFFAPHFFTVTDQEKSKDFYVRILGGKVVKEENPWYINWLIPGSFSIPEVVRLPTSQVSFPRHRRISTE